MVQLNMNNNRLYTQVYTFHVFKIIYV